MSLQHRIALVAVPVVLASAGVFVATSSSSSSASPSPNATTYSVTVTGTDLQSMDERAAPQIVPNTGGGVTPLYESGALPSGDTLLQTGINLPVGAKVTAVSFTVTEGDRTGCLGERLAFGSYAPASGGAFSAPISFRTTPHSSPCSRHTVTKTGSPIVTVAAGRRYAVEWFPQITVAYPGDNGFSSGIFHGATVKYTCTSPCVP